jgi:hypothetical protein
VARPERFELPTFCFQPNSASCGFDDLVWFAVKSRKTVEILEKIELQNAEVIGYIRGLSQK